MTLGKVAPGGAPALAPVKTAHQGVSTDAPPRATRSHFTYLPTWAKFFFRKNHPFTDWYAGSNHNRDGSRRAGKHVFSVSGPSLKPWSLWRLVWKFRRSICMEQLERAGTGLNRRPPFWTSRIPRFAERKCALRLRRTASWCFGNLGGWGLAIGDFLKCGFQRGKTHIEQVTFCKKWFKILMLRNSSNILK